MAQVDEAGHKQASVFMRDELVERVRSNVMQFAWAKNAADRITTRAQPWVEMSDDELWGLMFGPRITRSWMVWSDGFCPACEQPVPMYNWKMSHLQEPWKVICPQCDERFPKNDFAAFYASGLDQHGVFDPALADHALLFNDEHPEPDDPLHGFGVDDGEGYTDGEHRWRFIGAYLIYGLWKRAIVEGIDALAAAYVVSGDGVYAHKAGVLLDRVADLYPSFDFEEQALVYERQGDAGYISTWHDACEEARTLALAYDRVFPGLTEDAELVAFLSGKAQRYDLSDPRSSLADIRRHIEQGILIDTIDNASKIHSNYPRTEIALMTIKAILGWPGNQPEIEAMCDEVLERATAVDGVTGEKGLCGYSAYTVQGATGFLGQLSLLDDGFLAAAFERHPRLHEMFRFHLDTWCLGQYYPLSGDCGTFTRKVESYVGVSFRAEPVLEPSMYSLLLDVYEITGDEAMAQLIFLANDRSTEGLPYSLLAEDPEGFETSVAEIIERAGPEPKLSSVNKEEWCLGILRSGEGDEGRAVWLDYDSGGAHGHADLMNLGLFAKGLDLMPDFGYPPVHYGGWSGPKFAWYVNSVSHNTVVIDGRNSQPGSGRCMAFGDGETVRLIRAEAPEAASADRYERTVVSIDTSAEDFYVVDLFRVTGGAEHARMMQGPFAELVTQGLAPTAVAEDFFPGAQMRAYAIDPAPEPGWSADWLVDDRLGYLPDGKQVRLRYTDLSEGAESIVCEAWVAAGGFNSDEEAWAPRVITRRMGLAPLTSTFIGLIEPYEVEPSITAARRLSITAEDGTPLPNASVALEVTLADGRRDIIMARDADGAALATCRVPEYGIALMGDLCVVRLDADGAVARIAAAHGTSVRVGDEAFDLGEGFVEFSAAATEAAP